MEIKHIIKYKPSFILFEEEYETSKTGIKSLKELLCSEEKGFNMEMVRNLAFKYPPVLSKT